MSGVVFYTVILSFVSGIFIRSCFMVGWEGCVFLALLGGGVLLISLRKRTPFSTPGSWYVGISLFCLCCGMLRLELAFHAIALSPLSTQIGSQVTLTGDVLREPEQGARSTKLSVAVDDDIILVQTDRHSSVSYGDTVIISGKLSVPETFVTDLGREFNYHQYLAAQGILYTMSFAEVTVIDTTTGNPLWRFVFKIKAAFIDALELAIPPPEVSLGEGLLLGVKQAMGDELETAFRRAGIIHIVVLSGYNIMIVVSFVMYLLSFFLPLRARIVVGLLTIGIFAVMVGLGASVVRASIMAALGLLALVTGRRYALLRALMLAGFIMLCINPLLLVHDVGFQLSFVATLGLILVAPQFTEVLTGVTPRFSIREFLTATLATQIAVLPLLLYQIGEFSLITIVVNILVLPLVASAMLMTFLTGIIAIVSTGMALPFAYIAYVLLTYIIFVATYFAQLPFAAITVPEFPFVLVILMYSGFGYVLYLRSKPLTSPQPITIPNMNEWRIEEVFDESLLSSSENAAGELTTKVGRAHSALPTETPACVSPKDITPIFFR